MRTLAVILVLGLVAACKSDDGQSQMSVCGADGMQQRIGSSVEDHSFDENARIIPPGSAVTMDHRPDRLNIESNEDGIITRISCG